MTNEISNGTRIATTSNATVVPAPNGPSASERSPETLRATCRNSVALTDRLISRPTLKTSARSSSLPFRNGRRYRVSQASFSACRIDPIIAVADHSSPTMLISPIAESPVAIPSTAVSKSARPSPSESGRALKISSTTSWRMLGSVRTRPLIDTKRMASGKIENST